MVMPVNDDPKSRGRYSYSRMQDVVGRLLLSATDPEAIARENGLTPQKVAMLHKRALQAMEWILHGDQATWDSAVLNELGTALKEARMRLAVARATMLVYMVEVLKEYEIQSSLDADHLIWWANRLMKGTVSKDIAMDELGKLGVVLLPPGSPMPERESAPVPPSIATKLRPGPKPHVKADDLLEAISKLGYDMNHLPGYHAIHADLRKAGVVASKDRVLGAVKILKISTRSLRRKRK